MKPRIYLSVSLVFISFLIGHSQTLEGFDGMANLSNSAVAGFRSFDNRYKGVVGSVTIFPDFVNGKVNLSDGTVATNQKLNYDSYNRELLVNSVKMNQIMAIRSDKVTSFSLTSPDDEKEMLFVKLPSDGPGFYEQLYVGKISLYKKYEKVLEKANFGGAYNSTNARTSDEFVDSFSYRIKREDGTVIDFKPQKKELEKLFPDNKSALTSYLKSVKPSLKKDDDLVAVFAHMDK